MSALLSLAAGAVLTYLAVYYGFFRAARFTGPATLCGKTAIVTGSSGGIGKATALGLAKRGARVILACRNKEKAEAAAFDIRRASGNAQVIVMHLDLSSLRSVRSFAENFLKAEPRLDVLVNNAGVMGPGRTEDGFGLAFGVNHLGHFLLTNLLLERLRRCGPSRVVTVAAHLHRVGRLDLPAAPGAGPFPGDSAWSVFRAYCGSKLCNVLFTRELANRLEGTAVTCYSLHPGVVDTDLLRGLGAWRLLALPFAKLLAADAEGGAQTVLHCALREGIEHLSGRYFAGCALRPVGARGRDDAAARKLWEVSERLAGLS